MTLPEVVGGMFPIVGCHHQWGVVVKLRISDSQLIIQPTIAKGEQPPLGLSRPQNHMEMSLISCNVAISACKKGPAGMTKHSHCLCSHWFYFSNSDANRSPTIEAVIGNEYDT